MSESVNNKSTSFPGKKIYEFQDESGNGEFRLYSITEKLLAADINLAVRSFQYAESPELHQDGWIIINYCRKGRCEVSVPERGVTIIKPGDCTVNRTAVLPESYSYPLGFYEGIELFINPDLFDDPEFVILKKSGLSLHRMFPLQMWEPVFFSGQALIVSRMEEIGQALQRNDMTRCMLSLMQFLFDLSEIKGSASSHPIYYPRKQMDIARAVHTALTENIASSYSLDKMAAEYNISLGTLNNYFEALYGNTIPAFMRAVRMEKAQDLLLTTTLPICEVSAAVGYENASKFSSAFARYTGATPSAFRRNGL